MSHVALCEVPSTETADVTVARGADGHVPPWLVDHSDQKPPGAVALIACTSCHDGGYELASTIP